MRANDAGHFWPAPKPRDPGQSKPGGSRTIEAPGARWELTLRRKLLLFGLGASLLLLLADRRSRRPAAT